MPPTSTAFASGYVRAETLILFRDPATDYMRHRENDNPFDRLADPVKWADWREGFYTGWTAGQCTGDNSDDWQD